MTGKIAKLLRLAMDRAATPAEAALAAARAQELAARHRVDLAALMSEAERGAVTERRAARKNTALWRGSVWLVVAQANGCRVIGDLGGQPGFTIYGHPQDVEVVEFLGTYLERLIDRMSRVAYRTYRRGASRPEGAGSFKQGWCLGAAEAVGARLSALSQSASGVGVPAVVDTFIQRRLAERGLVQRGGQKRLRVSAAFERGVSAGAGIALGRAVTDNRRLLNTG
jgi:hypothetical protein